MSESVSLRDIQEARSRLDGIIHKTPVLGSRSLGEMVGAPLYFKCENLQRTGAFKIRGSYNKLAQLTPIQRSSGVVTASSGNSGCGTAYAGKLLGIRTVIVMSEHPAPAKKAACEAYGAELLFVGQTTSERLAKASELAQEQNLVIAHPYDDPQVIAGQGTIGLEMLEQLPDVEQIVIQIGGGGLLAGIAVALRESGYRGLIIGVEPEVSPRMAYAFQQGAPEVVPQWSVSIADGINSNRAGEHTYPLVRRHVDRLVTVSEAEIIEATKLLIERSKLFVEPSGAATFAAALAGKIEPRLKTICLISGGNTDLRTLHSVLYGN